MHPESLLQSDDQLDAPLSITWANLTSRNLKHLQTLNAAIFPVNYTQKFYSDAINAPPGLVKLAYHNHQIVGAVCCRKEPLSASASDIAPCNPSSKLYIMTLGVLAPYREMGIGTQLINHVFNLVQSSPHCADVCAIYLNVQEGNDEALRFYDRFGFVVTDKLMGYYKRIHPPNCFVVEKQIVPRQTTQNL